MDRQRMRELEEKWAATRLKELQAKWAACEHSYRRRTTGGKCNGRQTYREPHLHCHKCQHEKPIEGVTDDGTHVRVSHPYHIGHGARSDGVDWQEEAAQVPQQAEDAHHV